MDAKLTIPTAVLTAITTGMKDAVALGGKPQALLKQMGVEVVKETQQNIKAGGRPQWTPLKPSTLAARRQGKGQGAGQALQNTGRLLRSWDVGNIRVTDRELRVPSSDPVSLFHEFGTKGPYPIRAKHGKALAIPTGGKTLSGLTTGTIHGRRVLTPRVGGVTKTGRPRQVAKRLRGRIGKTAAPFKSLVFRQEVSHPGVPARPSLPAPEQFGPALVAIAQRFVNAALFRVIRG